MEKRITKSTIGIKY